MKKNIFKKVLPLCAIAAGLGFTACTGDFESYNTDPNGIPTENVPLESRFAQPIVSVYLNYQNMNWQYQLVQNLNADLYSGYMANPTAFGGNYCNSTYAMNEGWNNTAFEVGQMNIMKPISLILASTQEPDYVAIAKIIRAEGMHRIVDIYGPVPFSKAMQGGATVAYDDVETLYKTFIAELGESVDALTKFVDEGKADPDRIAFDKVCGRDHKQWIRFANTLRLRLAMRISVVEPALAISTAEAAVNHKYGVLEAENPDVEVIDPNLQNPLNEINYAYGDIRMGASIMSILQGYNDPRLPKYATPVGWFNDQDINDEKGNPAGYKGKYVGIRQGALVDKPQYQMYSTINMPKIKMTNLNGEGNQITNALPWMKVAESYFLRAEGVIRGWNMGGKTAQYFYEEGIKVSFNEYNIPNDAYQAYINDDKSVAADYVDPHNTKNNSKGLDKMTIKWDEGASQEDKLHRIINQKWLAMFPEGQEAWSEFRRTGYPKLFPVVNNFSGSVEGGIADGDFVKRLRFTRSEMNTNMPEVENARKLLGGPDNEATRLWWDTGRNF